MKIAITNQNEALNERNMLDGNLNRIFVTTEKEELELMFEVAMARLTALYWYHKQHIESNEEK